MSDDDKDDEFYKHNIIMTVKQLPEMSTSFACVNKSHELICNMEWENVMERVK